MLVGELDYFHNTVDAAVERHGDIAVATKCRTSTATVQRWAAGKSAPHRLGRPSVLDALAKMDQCDECGCWTGGADCPHCVPGAPHPQGRC